MAISFLGQIIERNVLSARNIHHYCCGLYYTGFFFQLLLCYTWLISVGRITMLKSPYDQLYLASRIFLSRFKLLHNSLLEFVQNVLGSVQCLSWSFSLHLCSIFLYDCNIFIYFRIFDFLNIFLKFDNIVLYSLGFSRKVIFFLFQKTNKMSYFAYPTWNIIFFFRT